VDEEQVRSLLGRLGLQVPPEDGAALAAYLPVVAQVLDALFAADLGEGAPAFTFAAPQAET
jgi:hypothetical protein